MKSDIPFIGCAYGFCREGELEGAAAILEEPKEIPASPIPARRSNSWWPISFSRLRRALESAGCEICSTSAASDMFSHEAIAKK